ncbi:MAG: hypothetical protein RLZZ511_2162 [Cyanobacteriota bacterium]
MTRDRGIPRQTSNRRDSQRRRSASSTSYTSSRPAVSSGRTVVASPETDGHPQPRRRVGKPAPAKISWKRRTLNILTDWRFFTLVGLSLTGGLTALSIAFIFKLPALPNCPAVFWPMASGSLRMHCAQLAASKETAPDLLEAIKLLNTLGPEHPLYSEASRLIETWSTQVLDLAEADFQAGKLKAAIAAARQIPARSSASKLVEERVKTWENTWQKAEEIYNKVGEVLKKTNLEQARTYAARLLSIDNEYWRSTKYTELSQLITATHQDMSKLGKAENAMRSGVVDDIVAALQEISGIEKISFVHDEAQKLMPKMGRKLLELAEAALDRKDYNGALDIANRIPGNVKLDQEVDDFRIIAQAQSKAWSGGSLNLEEAINDIQRIATGRPGYDRAQRLMGRWQAQLQETVQLEQAKQSAQAGNLQAALTQAARVSNPAAQEFVRETRKQVETQDDQPILDQAQALAANGDEVSLNNAIAQAEQIGSGRALHGEARRLIDDWKRQLRSQQVANNPSPAPNEFETVPAAAQNSDRAILQQATAVASDNSPDAILQAIGIMQSIPDSSPVRGEATGAIDQWSQQLVMVARSRAEYDTSGAIAIAQRVPAGTSGYAEAQALLGQLRQSIGQ